MAYGKRQTSTRWRSRDGRKLAILLWNYHDDDLPAAPAQIEIAVANAQNGQATLTHYRIDGERSNSYAAWQKMGSPAAPTQVQQRALESAGQLQQLEPPKRVRVADGRVTLTVQLPRQGVSLLTLTY